MANRKSRRLSREQWLKRALEILSKEGNAKLRIDLLSRNLGVSKGSFYWHFKDRADFVKRLAEYWARSSTEQAIELVNQSQGNASSRLLELMEFLCQKDFAKYDVAMRAWAAQEPAVTQSSRKWTDSDITMSEPYLPNWDSRGRSWTCGREHLSFFTALSWEASRVVQRGSGLN